jgi:hypothetical protein
MKRFLTLVAVATVAGAMYVAAAPGSQQSRRPTAKQFATLSKKVTALSKKVTALSTTLTAVKTLALAEAALLAACDKTAVPIDQFGATDQTQGYQYINNSSAMSFLTTALDVTDPTTDTHAIFITGGDSSCVTALGGGALRHAAARAGLQLQHGSLHPSFAAHRP